MPYSFRVVPDGEHEVRVYEVDVEVNPADIADNLSEKSQYEILDENGDYLITVYNETDAEVLISHLNRGM